MSLVKKIADWMLEKEEDLAKNCNIPIEEIDSQIEKIKLEKQKLKQRYDNTMSELDDVENKLQKIRNIEILRCSDM
jgi:chromosome segregation ATPase